MKKIFFITILLIASFQSNAQSIMDSIQDMVDHWKRFGSASVETCYMMSFHSNNDVSDYIHQKGILSLDLRYKKTKVKIGIGLENLEFSNAKRHITSYSYDIQYLLLPINFQYQIFNFQWAQLYLGVGIELDWIINYYFSSMSNDINHPSARNPEIGKKTGLNLQIPVSWYFFFSRRWGCFVNLIAGFRLSDDHDKPVEKNRWGVITPERELDTGLPLWLGLGLLYCI